MPHAHAFMRVLTLSHPTRSREGRVHMFERRADDAAAPLATRPAGMRPRRGAGTLFMASEEVGLGSGEFQL